jgi:hypothetical protein
MFWGRLWDSKSCSIDARDTIFNTKMETGLRLRKMIMRKDYDFRQGTRGKHAGKRLRIVGDKRQRNGSNSADKMAKNLVGTAGEYYVCAELCRMGYLALLTPKNNPLFDVVATNVDGTTSVSIQVKTRSVENTQGWKLSNQISPTDTPGFPSLCW